MITLLGDIHGDWNVLRNAIDKSVEAGATALIQVGDFGLFTGNEKSFYQVTEDCPIPVYFIDGNHDDCKRWTQLTEPLKLWNKCNLWYVPRGSVLEIDGRTLAFMGGAASIDKKMRLLYGWHWDEEENISPEEVLRFFENTKDKTIDVLITHCPPHSVIEEHFDPRSKIQFGVGLDWHDHNQDIIERLWKELGYPDVYSGHMHRRVEGQTYRILDINELLAI